MTEIVVLDKKFAASGKLKTDVNLSPESINEPVVHQVVKATLAGRRQGNASTKVRSEVRGGGAKPFKQKGTGRARQGSSRSGLMVSGARVHGPKPRDYTQKINKKVMSKAIQSVLADKLQAGKLTVVEKFDSDGKTKTIHSLLDGRKLLPALIVTSSKEDPVLRASRNLQWGKSLAVEGFSVYEVVRYENLVIEKEALESLLGKLV